MKPIIFRDDEGNVISVAKTKEQAIKLFKQGCWYFEVNDVPYGCRTDEDYKMLTSLFDKGK